MLDRLFCADRFAQGAGSSVGEGRDAPPPPLRKHRRGTLGLEDLLCPPASKSVRPLLQGVGETQLRRPGLRKSQGHAVRDVGEEQRPGARPRPVQHAHATKPAALGRAHTAAPKLLWLPGILPLGQSHARPWLAALALCDAPAGATGTRPPTRPRARSQASEHTNTSECPCPFKPTTSAPNRRQNCLPPWQAGGGLERRGARSAQAPGHNHRVCDIGAPGHIADPARQGAHLRKPPWVRLGTPRARRNPRPAAPCLRR